MIWWTKSWNPITGCTPCSPACANCYAEALHTQRHKALLAGKKMASCYSTPFAMVRFHPERLTDPLHWKKPQMIFVGNMGDLFHDAVVSFAFLDRIFATMARCPQHTFMLLTKRPELVHEYLTFNNRFENVWMCARPNRIAHTWPLPNVWLGTTIWDQASADRAVPILLDTPAAKRFVSVEPMLGPVDLTAINMENEGYYSGLYINSLITSTGNYGETYGQVPDWYGLDWVICGGETGANARPMHPDWPRSLRDQCTSAGVPFFFKQWGEWEIASYENGHKNPYMEFNGASWVHNDGLVNGPSSKREDGREDTNPYAMVRVGTRKAGRVLDGQEWSEVPA